MKKSIVIVMALVLAACGSGGGGSGHSRRADANGIYRVKSGDTLVLIARANGVDYTDLMRWNGLTNPNRLEIGWRLRVRPNASGTSNTPALDRPVINDGVAVTKVNPPKAAERDLGANPEINNTIRWQWPVPNALLVRFDGNTSKGVVFGGKFNDPVFAAADGVVSYAGNGLRGYGNMIVIKHSDTWSSVYANNASLLVKVNDTVKAGQTIAKMGNSDAARVQLYFETRLNAKPIDPLKVLPVRRL